VTHTRVLDLPSGVDATTASTARGAFAVLVARPPDGVEVRGSAVLVPGWTGSKDDFAAILPLLARAGWTVVAYDQRGQYESDGYPDVDDYSWTDLAADAAAVADWIDAGARVNLVGHSFGGLVSAAAVVGHPDRWASVTFLCSGPAGKDDASSQDGLHRLAESLDAIAEDSTDDRSAGMGVLWDVKRRLEVAAGDDLDDPESETFLRERFIADDPVGLAAFSRMLATAPDRIDDVARTEVAAFVVYGEDDDAWPIDLQDKMAARLGSAPVVIAGAGHSPTVDQPETTAEVLSGLWRSVVDDEPDGDEPAA
jgi:pimeloyl-ACP methyl ester carboxylesterase